MADITLTLRVVFNANGGSGAPAVARSSVTGSPSEFSFPYEIGVKLSSGTPTRTGYSFSGWSTSSSASSGAWWPGSMFYHTFQNNTGASQTAQYTLYAVWSPQYVYLNFNANGGSGAPSQQQRLKGVVMNLPATVPTRSGYKFVGWAWYSTGSGTIYQPGAVVSITSNSTLYAIWQEQSSTASVSPSRIAMDGSMTGTATITKANSSIDHHTVIVKVGSNEQTFTNVGTSKQFTLPLSCNSQVPNGTEITAKVIVHSYLSDGTEWGSASEATFTAYVPSSVVPSISISIQQQGNELVKSWGVYLQQYSSVKFTISASGQYSATITKTQIVGPDISASSSSGSLEATSGLFTSYGTLSYSIIAYDSRGRSKTETRTISVQQYFNPAILGLTAYRSDNAGVQDDIDGEYLTVKFTGSNRAVSSQNDVTVQLKYKLATSSSYTTISDNATANNNYIVSADITKTYNVYAQITDELNNSSVMTLLINTVVCSLSLGLNNDRARFGGPVRQAGLEVDWDAQFDGVVDVVNRRVSASLSSSGWYRVLSYNISSATGAKFATSAIIDFSIGSVYNNVNNMAHFVRMIGIYNYVRFVDESSFSNTTPLIDKIRYTYDSNNMGHVDVHYYGSSANTVFVDFDIKTDPTLKGMYTAESLQAVADAPSGETVLAMHSFTDNNTHRYLAKSYTTNSYVDSTAFNRIYAYQHGDMVQITFNLNFTSAMPTTSNFVEIGRFTLPTNRGFPFSLLQTLAGQKSSTNILVQISTSGVISIHNEFSTSASGWYRACITAELVPTELIT